MVYHLDEGCYMNIVERSHLLPLAMFVGSMLRGKGWRAKILKRTFRSVVQVIVPFSRCCWWPMPITTSKPLAQQSTFDG